MDKNWLKAEMEFLSACLLIGDLWNEKVITEQEYANARKALSDKQEHVSGCLESVRCSFVERGIRKLNVPYTGCNGGEKDIHWTFWSTRLRCGLCEDAFGRRKLYRRTYIEDAWMCRSRFDRMRKGCRCRNDYIYDMQLTELLVETGRYMIKRYGAIEHCLEELKADGEKESTIRSWKLTSVCEEDISMALKEIVVWPEKRIDIFFLDGTGHKTSLGKYVPKDHRH